MKSFKNPLAMLATALLILASVAALADSPFLGSSSDPHGTLVLNTDLRAKQTYPVEIWSVDGKLTNRTDQGMLWVKPGDYTFSVKVSHSVNLSDVPGLQRKAGYGLDAHDLKVSIEAGKAYYIGAKFNASGNWEPVVWKTEDAKN